MSPICADQLACHLNITRRRVNQLVHEGMPKAERGRYDLLACLEWYVRFLQRAVEHRESLTRLSSTDEVRRERAALLKTQREKRELELSNLRGELIPLSLIEQSIGEMIMQARQQLLQLPGRVAPQLEGEPRAVIRHKLTLAIHETLTALSRGEDIPADPNAPMTTPPMPTPSP